MNLESRPWYRGIKILCYVWLALAFVFPWYLNQDAGHAGSAYFFGSLLDGLSNVSGWLVAFFLLKRGLVYVVFGKQPSKPKQPFKPSENWSDFFKVVGLFLLVTGVVISVYLRLVK